MKLLIDHSDGCYSTRPLTDEEATAYEVAGCTVVYLSDELYAAYEVDCQREARWQMLWQTYSNESYVREREKVLRPLEEADWKIRQLEDDLARERRMVTYYETKYFEDLSDKHRSTHHEFTCVYPQPGCDVNLLPEEWREHAIDIIENYKPNTSTRQGCCCGHTHQKLHPETCDQLRNNGFIIEHNSEEL